MTRFGHAQDEPEDVEADELTGDEVDDGLDLDVDEWDDESTGGDPVKPAEEPQEPAQEPAEPTPDPEPTPKAKAARRPRK